MGFFDWIGDIFSAIEDDYTYSEMASEALDYLSGASDTGNPGQSAIMWDYVMPAAEDVISGWDGAWPEVYTGEFSDACNDSHERAWDCWSDTISEVQAIIEGWQEEANAFAEESWYQDEESDEDDEEGDF